jgi:hypothetical protein
VTPEEKDLIQQIRSTELDESTRLGAAQRIGELLEETFILDLLPSKAVIDALRKTAAASGTPTSLKRRVQKLLKTYAI